MGRLANSDVSEVSSAAANWLRLSQSSIMGELAHISVGEAFAQWKVAMSAFVYELTSSPLVQTTLIKPLLRASFAVAPVAANDPNAYEISKLGLEILHSTPGTVRPRRS
jgi:hypothetical protein